MKRLSLKAKLTLVYTLLMTAVVCGILLLLFYLSNYQMMSSAQTRLRTAVYQATAEIDFDDGRLEFDSYFTEMESGVYLSVYASDGTWLYGHLPHDFSNTAVFEDGHLRAIRDNNEDYYVMDVYTPVEDYGNVYIRGIISFSATTENVLIIRNMALILLPLLVAVTAVLGYFMTRRTLRPVSVMTATVREICRDHNLSRRIGLGNGKDEIYRLAQTFDELLAQVENGIKREQQFTSDVSHELRTPISAMVLQCESLLADPSLDGENRQGVEFLAQKVNYMSVMISQLLLLSRADQGRQQMVMERIDFSELVEMTAMEAEEMACHKEISVTADIAPGLYVRGDETLLIRMLMNLLENAVNYGHYRGHIDIRLWPENGFVCGSIRDDGIGIAPEHLPHIWERFYQADSARSAAGSSGLGLSMVAWIVQAHQGRIQAESTLGRGSCFTFFLPRS